MASRCCNDEASQPYPGTRAFSAADSDRFFGRATDAARVANLWQTNRLTIMHGAAGSGKTSLLGAGVLPLLRDVRAQILPPGPLLGNADLPIAALPRHNPFTLAVLRTWAPGQTVTSLVGLTIHDFLQRLADGNRGTILAPLDRAEDLLAETGPRRAQARQFLADLATAVRKQPRFHLLLSVRTEALDRFRDALGGGPSFGVLPLSPDNALMAVTGPARRAVAPLLPRLPSNSSMICRPSLGLRRWSGTGDPARSPESGPPAGGLLEALEPACRPIPASSPRLTCGDTALPTPP